MYTIKQSMLDSYLTAYKKREIMVWSGFAAIIILTAFILYITRTPIIIVFSFVGLLAYMMKMIKRVEDMVPNDAIIHKTNYIMNNRKSEIMEVTGEIDWNELLKSGWARLSTLEKTKEYGNVDRSNVFYTYNDTANKRFISVSFPIDVPDSQIKLKIVVTTTKVI